ncbi:M35 family metallo-endopeptidase [Shinella sp.]|uniref:M35 family metallo-endopeptidase n=1 Tax=Shinella sp. TaxID=1870904 RepID=UPI004036740C
MPNHAYKNFANVKERVAWESAVLLAMKYLPQIVKDAKANTKDISTRAYSIYFGAYDKTRWAKVIGTLSAMDFALQSGGITFVRTSTGGADECAATRPPYGSWKDQTPKQVADSSHARQDAYTMTVGDAFYKAKNSIDLTLKSAQFNTVCHELSHLVSGDVDDPVYGDAESRLLARSDPNTAAKCAENYGFYCEMVYSALAPAPIVPAAP